jgi:ParB-like chromosome segregation protein Spo0J
VSEMTFKQAEMRRDVARKNVLRAWDGETTTKALPRRWVDIDAIYIGQRLREPDIARVSEIAKSISEIGLLNPPAVRFVEKMTIDGIEEHNVPVLIVGHHRLLALKKLGKESVECDVYKVDPLRAELMEIAENLHRAELTVLERAKQVARWIELTESSRASDQQDKPAQVAPVSKGGRGKESGINSAARELGIERTAAQRDVKIASLSPEAEAAAVDAGLDDNQSALLEAARETEPERQVVVLRELFEAQAVKAASRASRALDKLARERDKAECVRLYRNVQDAEAAADRGAPVGNDDVGQANLRNILLMNIAAAIQAASYQGPVDDELVAKCGRVASAWLDLADELRTRLTAEDQQQAA